MKRFSMSSTCALIIAGGTGGHISPGLALYEEFRDSGIHALFLSGKRDARFSSLKEVAPDDLNLYPAPSFTKNPVKLAAFPFNFGIAVLRARHLIKKNDIQAVIGMGGYVSAPALVAAILLKKPVYLCEQNSVPGKVTKFFEKYARKIFGTFKVASESMNNPDKYVHAGNPIRKQVLTDARKDEARKAFHLGHARNVVLVIGGSQGALSINELVFGMKKKYPDEMKNVGLIWATGDLSFQRFKERIHAEIEGGSIYLSPYIDQVGLAYRAADVAISRSGAGVMMELAAMGVPSIQIPYPFAAEGHQDRNADEFVKSGAAVKMSNEDAAPDRLLLVLLDLLNNPRALKRMSDRALAIALPDASKIIVEDIVSDLTPKPISTQERGEERRGR
jgi:UDP-N-acetylglucosamine--N-acetylmuramyl-(pentapeptide) pyrophosphoryl-undecaprenol N-acetylglucosamine transferase